MVADEIVTGASGGHQARAGGVSPFGVSRRVGTALTRVSPAATGSGARLRPEHLDDAGG
jgi:hypothetical protein